MHHLTHAANQLESAFSDNFELRKCGVETPDAQGGRVNDGRSENITIEYDTETAQEGWSEFLKRLSDLEDEWEREGQHEGLSVLWEGWGVVKVTHRWGWKALWRWWQRQLSCFKEYYNWGVQTKDTQFGNNLRARPQLDKFGGERYCVG